MKVSRKKNFKLFRPTTDMNKLLDLMENRATSKPRNKEDKGDGEKSRVSYKQISNRKKL